MDIIYHNDVFVRGFIRGANQQYIFSNGDSVPNHGWSFEGYTITKDKEELIALIKYRNFRGEKYFQFNLEEETTYLKKRDSETYKIVDTINKAIELKKNLNENTLQQKGLGKEIESIVMSILQREKKAGGLLSTPEAELKDVFN